MPGTPTLREHSAKAPQPAFADVHLKSVRKEFQIVKKTWSFLLSYMSLNCLFKVSNTGFEDLHILLAIDIHCN